MVAGAKPTRISWFIVDNLYLSVAFYLAYIFASAAFLSSAGAKPAARAVRIAGVAVCLAGLFLLSTNFQFYGLPLSEVMVVLVLKQIGAQPVAANSRTLKPAALLVWGSLIVAGNLNYDAMGLGFGAETIVGEGSSLFLPRGCSGRLPNLREKLCRPGQRWLVVTQPASPPG
jgi:hypothetical protein